MEKRIVLREFTAKTPSFNGYGAYELTVPLNAEIQDVTWGREEGEAGPVRKIARFQFNGKMCICSLQTLNECTALEVVEA